MGIEAIFQLNPLLVIVLFALVISLIIVLAYKFFTNQREMKEMKEKLKDYQKQIKEHRKDPQKMMELQKKSMEINMKYMRHSLMPTIITLIPILFIFGWLNANIAYAPIGVGDTFTTTIDFDKDITSGIVEIINIPEEFTLINNATQDIIDNKAEWNLTAEKEGEYLLEYNYKNTAYTKEILITSKQAYASTIRKVNKEGIKTITINNKPLKTLNIFGLKLSWFWTYVIFSIVFTTALRKLFKVY